MTQDDRSRWPGNTDVPITQWLVKAQAGDDAAMSRVWAATLDELRHLAAIRSAREIGQAELETTEIVNEVWIRMHGGSQPPDFADRGMFFGAAWRVMGQLLIDHARTRGRRKRGGDRKRVDFTFAEQSLADARSIGDRGEEIAEAMDALAVHDASSHAIAVMKLCFDADRRHLALIGDVEPSEIDKRWRYARAFLRERLGEVEKT